MRPRPSEHRTHHPQIVIDDRLAAREPERFDQLPDPDTRELRVIAQQPVDLVLERLELR
jgi:hypothetical protein